MKMSLTNVSVKNAVRSLTFGAQIFRDNRYWDAVSKKTFATENPATGKVLTRVAEGDSADVDLCVSSARRAFESGVWSRAGPEFRKRVMLRWADLIERDALSITLLEVLEAGKPVSETLNGDLAETVKQIRFHAEAIDKINHHVTPTDDSVVSMVTREPLGVVACVLPWNFSAQMAAWKLGPALATGNSVVVKPAEQTSLATLRMAELAAEAGLPEGVLSVIPGFGPTAGKALGLHPDVDMVAFTGSTEVGRLFLRYSAESNLKRVSLECGGKSPQVVLADAGPLLPIVAQNAVNAAFWNMSENCSCGSRLVVARGLKDELLELMQRRLDEHWIVGDPLDVSTMVGPLIERQHMERVLGYIEKARSQEGTRLVRGGKRVLEKTGGYFVEPTIFDGVKNNHVIAREEIFGPVLAVIAVESDEEAVQVANDSPYGLAASLYTPNLTKAHRVSKQIRAGCVSVNTFSEGGIGTPFGGYKQSGFGGRDKSIWAHDQYTEMKTTWIKLT